MNDVPVKHKLVTEPLGTERLALVTAGPAGPRAPGRPIGAPSATRRWPAHPAALWPDKDQFAQHSVPGRGKDGAHGRRGLEVRVALQFLAHLPRDLSP